MGAYKDKNGTWYAQFLFTNWKGEPDRKIKRGFATKKEALEWERDFLTQNAGNLEMTFEAFYELYKKNLQDRLKKNTWKMKTSVIESKILPYFKKKRMCDIKPRDIVAWQNVMLKACDDNGEPYSPVYLKTIHNQLSAIFNHAVKFYELDSNPAAKVGNMGKEKTHEMLFWTKAEYLKFAEAIMDKPVSFYAFEVLYWCGLRLGELLALTPADFDLEKKVLHITKSYQRIESEDIIGLTSGIVRAASRADGDRPLLSRQITSMKTARQRWLHLSRVFVRVAIFHLIFLLEKNSDWCSHP